MSNRRFNWGICWCLPLFLLTVAATGQDDGSAGRLLRLEDYNNIHTPGAPRISPNGKQIAYSFDEQVFVVTTSDAESRAAGFDAITDSSPHQSTDGSSLYFLSDRGDTSQPWRLPVDTYIPDLAESSFAGIKEDQSEMPLEAKVFEVVNGVFGPAEWPGIIPPGTRLYNNSLPDSELSNC